MAAEETRGGFTKSQWEDLIRRLHDPKDPTGNYRSPNPPRFTPGGAGGLKQVKNLMDGLKIAAYYGGPEQQKKDELRKAIEAFGKAHPINPVRSEEDINIRTKKRFPVGY